MKVQRWTIETTDDRFGDGKLHPYEVEGVTTATEVDGVLYLHGVDGPLGAFPLDNVTGKRYETYEVEVTS